LWLALFKANTEEELKMIDDMGVTELSEAVKAYHNVTLSPEFREMEFIRLANEASALHNAEKRGHDKGRDEGLKEGRSEGLKEASTKIAHKLKNARTMTIAEIAELTELTTQEIEQL